MKDFSLDPEKLQQNPAPPQRRRTEDCPDGDKPTGEGISIHQAAGGIQQNNPGPAKQHGHTQGRSAPQQFPFSIEKIVRPAPARFTPDETTIRIPTGIISLDQKIRGGASCGKLHLIAAYTGNGKSSFAIHLTASATRHGYPVIFCYSEMEPENDYIPRLLSWETGIPYGNMPPCNPDSRSLPEWIRQQVFFHRIPKRVPSALTVIRKRIEQWQNASRTHTFLVIVDSIDSVDDSVSAYDKRMGLEAFCTGLAGIAEDLKVPTWATTQANDQAAHQDIVTMQNLCDAKGKAIPCSLFLGLGMSEESRRSGLVTINAEKNRDGQPFVLRVRADLACQRFSDLYEPL